MTAARRDFAVILGLMAAGCGAPEARVRGTATAAGRPVSAGTVRFEPAGGGLSASAEVSDGSFEVPGGVAPGRDSVRVDPPAVLSDPDPKAPRPVEPFAA
ncbi:MAG: hypothetical protein ACRC7O_10535, partial [Fimbriiglobus sp.]